MCQIKLSSQISNSIYHIESKILLKYESVKLNKNNVPSTECSVIFCTLCTSRQGTYSLSEISDFENTKGLYIVLICMYV